MSGIFKALFSSGSPKSSPAPAAAAPTATTATGAAVAPGTTAEDYKKQQTAYYQQMLAGLGQGSAPGGGLPEGIQKNIDAQAATLGK